MYKHLILFTIALLLSLTSFSQSKKGYQGDVSLGYLTATTADLKGQASFCTTTHGYSFGNGTFLGAGTGVDYSFTNKEFFIPAFVEGRYYFNDKDVSPFVSTKIGGLFAIERVDNSLIILPSFGLKLPSVSLQIGYQYSEGYSKKMTEKTDYKYSSIFLALSYLF